MSRGGARKGAGRPAGQGFFGEPTQIMRIPLSRINEVKTLISNKSDSLSLPLYDMSVSAGTPNIADNESYELYNLGEKVLVNNPENYFLVKVSGESMKDAGIMPDDILLVNRKKEPVNNNIIVAAVDDGVVVKRLSKKNGVTKLISDNEDYADIDDQNLSLHLWGVVTRVIREY